MTAERERRVSLVISIFERDEAGQYRTPRVIDGPGGLAGVERTRWDLWGSDAAVQLGARLLPQLAVQDLLVEGDELEDLRRECTMLLERAHVLAEATGWDAEYVAYRLRNVIAAADMAREIGGGVLID